MKFFFQQLKVWMIKKEPINARVSKMTRDFLRKKIKFQSYEFQVMYKFNLNVNNVSQLVNSLFYMMDPVPDKNNLLGKMCLIS